MSRRDQARAQIWWMLIFLQTVAVGLQKRLIISLKLNFFCPDSLRAQAIPEKSSLRTLEISRGSERRMKARAEVLPTHCKLERVRAPPQTPVFPPQEHRNPVLSHSPQSSIRVTAVRGALHRMGVGALLARSPSRPWSRWMQSLAHTSPLGNRTAKKESQP